MTTAELYAYMYRWVVMWLGAFVFTQLIEAPLYYVALRDLPSKGKRVLASLAPSALTHPAVWFMFPFGLGLPWMTTVVVSELFAFLTEALFLWCCGVKRALLWSLAANGLSFGIGLLLGDYLDNFTLSLFGLS